MKPSIWPISEMNRDSRYYPNRKLVESIQIDKNCTLNHKPERILAKIQYKVDLQR